jgi:hypothetical protein
MPHSTLRILACLAPALAWFTVAACAEAGVGAVSGGALSSVAHESQLQTVQSGECWEQNGPDGPGYYPCGDGGGGPIVSPAIRRHHRRGVIVSHPQATNPIHPGAQSGRVGAGGGVPSPSLRGVGAPAYGAGGVHSAPGLRPGATTPVSPGLAGVHGPGGAAGAHIGAAASPGLVGGATAVPHIASPSPVGAPHIGAPASPGLAGVHGPAAIGAFHGGGIGHR